MLKLNFKTLLFLLVALPLAAAAQSSGIKGKVRDVDHRAIAGVEVSARQEGKVVSSTKTDSKGRFTLSLSPGTYNVAFDAKGYGTGVKYDVKVKDKDIRDLGDNLLMTRDRGTLVLVKGVVFDNANLSVRNAPVDLYEIKSDGSTRKIQTVYTNLSGDFEFNGISGVERVKVTASAKGVSASNEITIDTPQVYRTVIKLPLEHEKRN